MLRKRSGRRRGRPRQAHAKLRTTTHQGRRAGIDPVDEGTAQLRQRKHVLTTRTDVELTLAGILFGRGHPDRFQYDALGYVTQLLRNIQNSMGKALWSAIMANASSMHSTAAVIGDHNARKILARLLGKLDGSHALVLQLAEDRHAPPPIERVLAGKLTPADLAALETCGTGSTRSRRRLGGASATPGEACDMQRPGAAGQGLLRRSWLIRRCSSSGSRVR